MPGLGVNKANRFEEREKEPTNMTTDKTFSDRLFTLSSRLDEASGLLKSGGVSKKADRLNSEVGINFITELEQELNALIDTIKRVNN
tara:strand:+ start:490 stop:750 length:261 start_codon:yes stop_codon:yes gene_type:complete